MKRAWSLQNVAILLGNSLLLVGLPSMAYTQASVRADFNGDGFEDLAVGVSSEDIGSLTDAGAVNVIYGKASGLRSTGNQLWHQNIARIQDVAEPGDLFGAALSAGDFDSDGFDDLAVGVRFENVGSLQDAGAVNVIYGTGGGLSATGNQLWHQDISGIQDAPEQRDEFGQALTAGDFDDDGFDDLAVGVPGEDIGNLNGAGAVNVIYGTASGLSATGDQLWHQDIADIQGTAETGDLFGRKLTAGDFDNDGFADLAVGAPFENVGSLQDAGAVNVIYGTGGGLSATGDQLWHQDIAGILGAAEAGDGFGFALSTGDFDADGFADLAVGVPNEAIGSLEDAGAVNVIYGTAGALSATDNQLWHQDIAGILDAAEAGDGFGIHLMK